MAVRWSRCDRSTEPASCCDLDCPRRRATRGDRFRELTRGAQVVARWARGGESGRLRGRDELDSLFGHEAPPELAQGAFLDLTDALAGQVVAVTDLLQRELVLVVQAETPAQDLGFHRLQ